MACGVASRAAPQALLSRDRTATASQRNCISGAAARQIPAYSSMKPVAISNVAAPTDTLLVVPSVADGTDAPLVARASPVHHDDSIWQAREGIASEGRTHC